MRDRRPRRLGAAPDAAGCSLGAALELPLPPCASAAVAQQLSPGSLGASACRIPLQACHYQWQQMAYQLNSIMSDSSAGCAASAPPVSAAVLGLCASMLPEAARFWRLDCMPLCTACVGTSAARPGAGQSLVEWAGL
jgi:hypothetical protein